MSVSLESSEDLARVKFVAGLVVWARDAGYIPVPIITQADWRLLESINHHPIGTHEEQFFRRAEMLHDVLLPRIPPTPKFERVVIEFGDFKLDHTARRLTHKGAYVHLNPVCYTLLAALAAKPGVCMSLYDLYVVTGVTSVDSVKTFLCALRGILKRYCQTQYIATVRSVGYRFDPQGEPPREQTLPEKPRDRQVVVLSKQIPGVSTTPEPVMAGGDNDSWPEF